MCKTQRRQWKKEDKCYLSTTQSRVKKSSLNKSHRSVRKVSGWTGLLRETVRKILNKSAARPYHKYRGQNMTDQHKEKRVQFCQYLIDQYGTNPRPGTR